MTAVLAVRNIIGRMFYVAILFVLHSLVFPHGGGRTQALVFPHGGGRTQALSSTCKTDRADFTNLMSFLPSNVIEEISLTQALSTNTLSLSSAWKTRRRQ